MTQLSFTSGEILDVISALVDKANAAGDNEEYQLAAYYENMIQQFERVIEKLEELPGEKRVANLVMAF
jgi:hypothetical protein